MQNVGLLRIYLFRQICRQLCCLLSLLYFTCRLKQGCVCVCVHISTATVQSIGLTHRSLSIIHRGTDAQIPLQAWRQTQALLTPPTHTHTSQSGPIPALSYTRLSYEPRTNAHTRYKPSASFPQQLFSPPTLRMLRP